MQINPFPLALLILLAFFAVIIFTVFKLSRQYALPLVKNRKAYRYFDLWIFRGELLTWAIFIAFAIYRLIIASPYLSIIFIAILMLAGRAFWKDFIPGLLFRIEKHVEIGDSLRYGNGNCTIENINPRNLQLRNKDGEIIILPYSHIDEAVISKSVQKSKLYQFTFKIILKKLPTSTAILQIEKYIQECPWSVPSRQPTIHSLGDGDYEITSFTTDENAAAKQRMYVEGKVNTDESS